MQAAYGRTVYPMAVRNDAGAIVALALIIVLPLPFGKSYFFSPRGPIISDAVDAAEVYRAIVQSDVFRKIARLHHSLFWRFEPLRPLPSSVRDFTAQKVEDVEPSMTSVIDLAPSEDELLAALKLRTRYNVRLAAKKGVTVKFVVPDTTASAAEIGERFFTFVEETSKRHQIRSHEKRYYHLMIQTLAARGMLEMAIAYHDTDVLAMNMLVYDGDTVSYLHSGSTRIKKELKAPYLLQWETIRRAKMRGMRWYDLHGIGPNDPGHRLYGVTQFKEGFGGRVVQFPGTFEFPISRVWYRIYRTVKRFQ